MNPINDIIYKLGWLHDIFDPLLGQRRYAQRTLSDKRNTITFMPCNSSLSLKIKELWGRSNAWFDFCINSISIVSFFIDGEVKILSSILRLGVGNPKVDNVSSGGVACGIGCLRQISFNAKGQSWDGHPDGLRLRGRIVPAYKECCEMNKKIAPRFVRFSRLISWDFAVDKNGKPLLIEANLYGGKLDFHQMCNGPIWGDETTTKEMIARFFIKKRSQKWKELLT